MGKIIGDCIPYFGLFFMWSRIQSGRLCKVPRMNPLLTGSEASYPLWLKGGCMAGVWFFRDGAGSRGLMSYLPYLNDYFFTYTLWTLDITREMMQLYISDLITFGAIFICTRLLLKHSSVLVLAFEFHLSFYYLLTLPSLL